MRKQKHSVFIVVLIILLLSAEFYLISRIWGDYKSSPDDDAKSNSLEGDYLMEMSGISQNSPSAAKNQNPEIDNFRALVKNNRYPAKQDLDKYYDKIGPNAMLFVLEENKFCHSESHALGRIIYERTKNLAESMGICKSRCSSGCFHGVLMQMFKEQFLFNLSDEHEGLGKIAKSDMKNIMSYYCNKSEISKFIVLGNCFHAMGHAALFLADYNLSKALEYCKLNEGNNAIYYCYTGVYMEYDIVNSAKIDGLYPCNTEVDFPAACYRYKIRRIFNITRNPKEAIAFCSRMEKNQRAGCFHGLGVAYYPLIYKNPKAINNVCAGTQEDKKMCIDGSIQLLAITSPAKASLACESFEEALRPYCFSEINYKTFNMKKPLDLYIR